MLDPCPGSTRDDDPGPIREFIQACFAGAKISRAAARPLPFKRQLL
jgi:hypothetical protein